jgi:hypothetical protein
VSTVEALKRRVKELETIRPSGDYSVLERRCATLMKERQAVQTIMEEKIRVLLQNISSSSSVVLREAPESGGGAGQALKSNVAALNRLVTAFIAALRNASSDQETRPPPAPPKAGEEGGVWVGAGAGAPAYGVHSSTDPRAAKRSAPSTISSGGGEGLARR